MPGRRAALYARYSTDLQNDRSVEDQFDLCQRYADREGLTVTHRYEDRAKSSATLFGRDGLLSLIADAKARAFDVVVVEALDRLSRDAGDLHGLRKTFDFAGVRIDVAGHGTADTLTIGMHGILGEMFLEQLKEKTRRGLTGVVKSGRSAGGRAYGYASVPGQPGELAIVEDEAEVVRRIFAEYLAGASTREIVAGLNADGIASPRGALWQPSTLTGNAKRGYGILWNDLYAGRRIWNRVSMVRDPETGKRVSRTNPEAEWIIEEVPQLAIVEADVFDQVRAKRLARMELQGERRKRPPRPLSGKLICDACGGPMTIRDRRANGAVHAACRNATEAGACTERSAVRMDKIEAAIFEEVAEILRDPAYVQAYLVAYHEERQRLAHSEAKSHARLERSAIKARAAFDRAYELYVDGVTDGPDAKAKLIEKRRAAEAAEAELANAAPPQVVTLHPQATRRYLDALTTLSASLSDTSTPQAREAMDTIRNLISEVRVEQKGGEVHATVYGYLAALLEPSRRTEMVAWGRSRHGQPIELVRIAV